MNLTFLAPLYPTAAEVSAGTFHRTQALALSSLGINVTVVAPTPWVPPLFGNAARWKKYRGIPAISCDGPLKILRPKFIQIPRANDWFPTHRFIAQACIRTFTCRPDVIYSHFAFPCGLASIAIKKRLNVPVILTLHGSDVNVYPQRSKINQRRFAHAVKNADSVTAVSQALADRAAKFSGRLPEVIPIGIEIARFTNLPNKFAARRALGLPLDKKLGLFVGHLLPAKGVPELLKALCTCSKRGFVGVVCGQGSLFQQVQEHRSAIAVGEVPNALIPSYLAASDVMILPSHSEGMPTVLVEAGAASVPIIATNVGGIPELLGNSRGLLIKPGDPDSIVKAVDEVVFSNPDAAQDRASRLKEHVLSQFDSLRNAGAIKDILIRCRENMSSLRC